MAIDDMPRTPRRRFLARLAGFATFGAGALALRPARAASPAAAQTLVQQVLSEIMGIINSGRAEAAMLAEFEQVFTRYADVNVIARSVLGPAARTASTAQISAFTAAFRGYMARKYGRRFRELIGAQFAISGARDLGNFIEVVSTATLVGQPPYEVRWHVSDRSGRNLFFNMVIEGVSMLAVEREEIGAMLDQRRGDVDRLTADLRRMG